jgi:spore germination protein KB
MNIEKGKISGLQFSFLIIGFIEGSIILVSYASNITRQNTWLAVLAGLIIMIPFVYIYTLLAKRFPGMNFAQIHRLIYGNYLGSFLCLLYLGFFLLILSFNIRDLGNFYNTFMMRDTPLEIFLIIFAFTCAYAAWNGIEVLARTSQVIVFIVTFILIIATLILLPKMDFSNLLPLLDLSFKDFLHGTQIITEIPFGEVVVFLTLTFSLNNTQHLAKNWLFGLSFGAFLLFMITVLNAAVLGNTEEVFISPFFHMVRLINIGLLSRMDVLFAMGYTFGLFIKCSILLYSLMLLLSQFLQLRTYSPIIFPLCCILIILSATIYPSIAEHFQTSQNAAIMMTIPFIHLFPILSLLIATIRKLPKKGSK